MLSAKIKKGALACVLASIAWAFPVAFAETADETVASRNLAQLSLPSVNFPPMCNQPDAQTLQAILPVATDHGSYATGIVFDTNRVLTAAHAVQGGERFYVKISDTFRLADLVTIDHSRDLAVLAVNTQAITPLHLNGLHPHESQQVWAVGYPRAQAMMTSTGVFQDTQGDALHTSASIDSGQSGGGLLSCVNGAWELLGMLRGYGAYLQGDQYVKIQNHSVSVAAATIDQFLRTYY